MPKELPNSNRLEQSLLGSMMLYPSVLKDCIDQGLHKQEFFLPAHQEIYNAIVDVHQSGKPADLNNVAQRLIDHGLLDRCGGYSYISDLMDGAVSSVNATSYIHTIKNKAQLRDLIATCEKISNDSFQGEEEIEDILDKAEKSILEVTRQRRGSDFIPYGEVISDVLVEVENLKDSPDGISGLETGFKDLDQITSGLHPGDLIILAARPAMGKSAFALNLVSNVAKLNPEKGAVALFSLEMPGNSLIKRILSKEAHIQADKFRSGRMTDEDMEQLYRTADRIGRLKIFVDDTSAVRVSEIFSKCRKLKSENNGISLIVIDYLQLISGNSIRGDSRQQEVSEISRNLKILAKEMECPVVALSQLSRKVEERTNHEPMLSDLRESGSIEQDADIVMFLYRESYYENQASYFDASKNDSNPDYDLVDLSIAKHRNGSTGKIKLVFEKSYSSFYSADVRTGNQ